MSFMIQPKAPGVTPSKEIKLIDQEALLKDLTQQMNDVFKDIKILKDVVGENRMPEDILEDVEATLHKQRDILMNYDTT